MNLTITGRIVRTERMPSSVNGNPRFRVTLSDDGGSYPTSPDAMLAYGIENREYREHDHVFTINRRGHLVTAVRKDKS